MLFSSIPFLYAFLPLTATLYFAAPKKLKNGVLLLFSLVFYGWGEPKYLLLMLFSITQGYIFGLLIERTRESRRSKVFLTASVFVSLLLLGYCKYVDFFIGSFNSITGLSVPLLKVALPIGISFYTFQLISYTVDVYRGVPAQRSFIDLAAYISLFPQLIAGPIVRYSQIAEQLSSRRHSLDKTALGIRRFVLGLGKKVLIANALGQLCEIFRVSQDKSVLFFWLYGIANMLHIYFDFSGYSDMAIGLGRMLGFDFPENFNYPYISKSVTEFWRRWHITLGIWFRDYLYIPLGGSRRGKWTTVRNKLIVFFCTGLWHGAGWTYILWGLWHGVLVSGEGLFKAPIESLQKKRGGRIAMHVYTLLAVVLGFAMFRASSVQQGFLLIARMFSFAGAGAAGRLAAEEILTGSRAAALVLGAVLSTPVVGAAARRCTGRGWEIVRDILALLGLFAAILALSGGSFTPFIYQQF